MERKMSDYFVIQQTMRPNAQQIRISGDLILKGDAKEAFSTDIPTSGSGGVGQLPPRGATWVLPPRTNEFYDRIKSFAQSAGYATIEHEARPR
jgi:hypothetical protein